MTIQDTQELDRLEHYIGRLLRGGVAAVVILIVIGLVLDATGHASAHSVLEAALVILLFVPGSRVVASFIDALRRRDQLLAWSTGIVIAILVWQWVGR